jgi:hypothetical protein
LKSLGSSPPVHTEKTRISSRPTQKYGSAEVTTNAGGSSESSRLPRRQPATTPISEPSRNASTVAVPTSPSVQGRACRMIRVTGSPSVAPIEMPHCPVTMFFR